MTSSVASVSLIVQDLTVARGGRDVVRNVLDEETQHLSRMIQRIPDERGVGEPRVILLDEPAAGLSTARDLHQAPLACT
jgi:hypothetical protein